MPEPSEYTSIVHSEYTSMMLHKFVERYDVKVVEHGVHGMRWYQLPALVKKSMVEAFLATVTEIQGDMH